MVLKQSLARALAMVGDGQKHAVSSILGARETAEQHGRVWQKIAEASVKRHQDAKLTETELKASQVRVALLHPATDGAPTASDPTGPCCGARRRRVSARGAVRGHAPHAARGRTRGKPPQPRQGSPPPRAATPPFSSRMNPFYGPVSAEGRHVTVAEKFVAVESLRRTQQVQGP